MPHVVVALNLKNGDLLRDVQNINSHEIISGIIRIHESQSAINQEFKFRSIQASSVHPASPKGFAT